jgi:Eukaryotic aspartyl protease
MALFKLPSICLFGLAFLAWSSDAEPGVVGFQFERRAAKSGEITARGIFKRSGTALAPLMNQETLYLITVTMGTPPQRVQLLLDTGSSDIWVSLCFHPTCLTHF